MADEQEKRELTFEEILGGPDGGESEDNDRWADYPLVTCEKVAALHLQDCYEQLERSAEDPLRLAQAAKSAHMALQAALTVAVAGSMGIGAYPEKLRIAWLAFLEGAGDQPESDKVMSFTGLLAKATSQKLEWVQCPLTVSDDEQELLRKLTFLRDRMEHPRPSFWLIEPAYIHRVLPLAAKLTLELLCGLRHHFEPGELEALKPTVRAITDHCAAPQASECIER